MTRLPPFLRFTPIYKNYLWGGDAIPRRYGRAGAPRPCAESWELSAHPDGDSTVAAGPLAGRTLSSLAAEFGRDITGVRAPFATRFPLLCKLIDARQSLSVQVHPSPADPAANPLEYKNECWHVIDASPGCAILAGLDPAIRDKPTLAALAKDNPDALAAALTRHAPNPGETLYIPAGLVHAIGAGALIYEVQQSANTTYRLHDWGRVGPDGLPRPLHIDAAVRSIDLSLPPPRFQAHTLATPYFTIRECRAAAAFDFGAASFAILFAKAGAFSVSATATGETERLRAGESLLVVPEAPFALEPDAPGSAALITTL